jgi:hypothetical protein
MPTINKKFPTPKNTSSELHLLFLTENSLHHTNILAVSNLRNIAVNKKIGQWIMFRKSMIILICRRHEILNLICR